MNQAVKSAVVYSTGRPDTTDLIFSFARGLQEVDGIEVETVDIQEYKSTGLKPETDFFVILGILRGTGLVFRECRDQGIDFFYIDHAYFNAGYERGWLRLVKNHHTMCEIQPSDSLRWDTYFAAENPLSKWSPRQNNGDVILVLPPTQAVSWMFHAQTWLEDTLQEIQKYTDKTIVVRPKPNEPHVDDKGEPIGMVANETHATSLAEDLQRAHCVVAYNSNSTILATRLGIPVITTQYNPCFSITRSFNQLESDALLEEPPREQLFHWLAYNQFHFEEFQNGEAWRHLFTQSG